MGRGAGVNESRNFRFDCPLMWTVDRRVSIRVDTCSENQLHLTRVHVRDVVASTEDAWPLTAATVIASQLVERFIRVLPVLP